MFWKFLTFASWSLLPLFNLSLKNKLSRSLIYRHILKKSNWKWWWIPKAAQSLKQKLQEVRCLLCFIQRTTRSMLMDFPLNNSLTPCVTVDKKIFQAFKELFFCSCSGLPCCTVINNAVGKPLDIVNSLLYAKSLLSSPWSSVKKKDSSAIDIAVETVNFI